RWPPTDSSSCLRYPGAKSRTEDAKFLRIWRRSRGEYERTSEAMSSPSSPRVRAAPRAAHSRAIRSGSMELSGEVSALHDQAWARERVQVCDRGPRDKHPRAASTVVPLGP